MAKKGGTTKQTQVQETKFDPTVTNLALSNLATANQTADGLKGYTGQLVADFNPTQLEANDFLSSIGRGHSDGLNDVADTARGLSQFSAPTLTGATYNPAYASAS